MSSLEQTLSIIKPDAVERNLEDKIKSFFEKKNLKIIKSKKVKITKEEAEEFYKVHQAKPFYNELCSYLSSGPIIVMILEGENAISENRKIMGATDPKKAEEGTIRKSYGISIDKNSVHGSDSVDNAKTEIDFFFKKWSPIIDLKFNIYKRFDFPFIGFPWYFEYVVYELYINAILRPLFF